MRRTRGAKPGIERAAHWTAARTQTTVGAAITSIETAYRLNKLPATREAFASGRLSEVQTAEISAAASADPSAESSLLALAERGETLSVIREQCRQVRASAAGVEDSVERIRRGRYLRNWVDRDGAVRLDARLAPDDGARLLAVVESSAAQLQREARRSGQREPAEAYAADALTGLVSGSSRPPRAVVHVHVDADALERGRVRPGETCRIPGVGPIPISTAQKLAREGSVKVIERDGVYVRRVAHLGRTIPAHVRTALEVRDPTCVVPGCDVRSGLEIDHIVPLAAGGATKLDNLARLCRFHHAQKTYHSWALTGSPGDWRWEKGKSRSGGAPNKDAARPP